MNHQRKITIAWPGHPPPEPVPWLYEPPSSTVDLSPHGLPSFFFPSVNTRWEPARVRSRSNHDDRCKLPRGNMFFTTCKNLKTASQHTRTHTQAQERPSHTTQRHKLERMQAQKKKTNPPCPQLVLCVRKKKKRKKSTTCVTIESRFE